MLVLFGVLSIFARFLSDRFDARSPVLKVTLLSLYLLLSPLWYLSSSLTAISASLAIKGFYSINYFIKFLTENLTNFSINKSQAYSHNLNSNSNKEFENFPKVTSVLSSILYLPSCIVRRWISQHNSDFKRFASNLILCITINHSVSGEDNGIGSFRSMRVNRKYGSVEEGFLMRHYVDIESTALVERLLNEVMQTTEAFQKLKNENTVIA